MQAGKTVICEPESAKRLEKEVKTHSNSQCNSIVKISLRILVPCVFTHKCYVANAV